MRDAARQRLDVEFFDHGDAESVERVGGFVIFAALIVAEERKDERAAAGSFGETGARADVLDGAGFCVDASGSDRGAHAIFKCAVNSGDGKRREIGGEPRLRLRIFSSATMARGVTRSWRERPEPSV